MVSTGHCRLCRVVLLSLMMVMMVVKVDMCVGDESDAGDDLFTDIV